MIMTMMMIMIAMHMTMEILIGIRICICFHGEFCVGSDPEDPKDDNDDDPKRDPDDDHDEVSSHCSLRITLMMTMMRTHPIVPPLSSSFPFQSPFKARKLFRAYCEARYCMASQDAASGNEHLNLRRLIETMPLPTSSVPDSQRSQQPSFNDVAFGVPTAKRTGGPPGSQHDVTGCEVAGGEPSKKRGGLVLEDFAVCDTQWEVWSQSLQQWIDCEVKGVFMNKTTDDNFEVPARSVKVQSKNGIKYIREFNIPSWMRPKRNDSNGASGSVPSAVVVADSGEESAKEEKPPSPRTNEEKAPSPRTKEPDAPASKRIKMMSSVCDMVFNLEEVPADLMPYVKDLVPNNAVPSDVVVSFKIAVCHDKKC